IRLAGLDVYQVVLVGGQQLRYLTVRIVGVAEHSGLGGADGDTGRGKAALAAGQTVVALVHNAAAGDVLVTGIIRAGRDAAAAAYALAGIDIHHAVVALVSGAGGAGIHALGLVALHAAAGLVVPAGRGGGHGNGFHPVAVVNVGDAVALLARNHA